MRTFAEKPKTTQPTESANASSVGRSHVGRGHDPNWILHVQRTIGNQAVVRLLQSNTEQRNAVVAGTASPYLGHDFARVPVRPPDAGAIQTKLAISAPGDEYEQEADRVAVQVMRTPDPQIACACGEESPKKWQTENGAQGRQGLQTKHAESGTLGLTEAPPSVLDVVRSPGRQIDPATRAFMEPRFGYDFSRVRVHSDAAAEQSARDMNARAYTVGQNIAFGRGQFVPGSHEGQRLLAHELTHVVQQSRWSQPVILMRAPNGPAGAGKPPVPKPGHTPFNFISESPALENWKMAVKEMLEREFNVKFSSFEKAQEHFRKYLQGLPSDAAREDFADRMRDRARKAFYRKEGANPSYDYKPEDASKLKRGAAPEARMQLEHMEDVKSKRRGGTIIKGQPERALDPDNIYVTEGGPGGTAPKGTKHAEKYRAIEAAKKKSLEIRNRTTQTAVEAEGGTATPSAKPHTPAPAKPPAATTTAPKPPPVQEPLPVAPTVKSPAATTPAAAPAPVVEGKPSPVVAPPIRPTSAWKAGLKAGGKALLYALVFAGLDYLVHRRLEKELDESIDKARHGAMPWAQRLKRDDPSKPVYMSVKVQSEDYSKYVPLLGWMPETPVLHMIAMAMVREEIDPPLVEQQDHRLNVWRPGVTTTVTYTELMIP